MAKGRLAYEAGIHGNLPALEAVLRSEPKPSVVIFCGDVVDYGRQSVECLRWLVEHAALARVLGAPPV